MVAPHTDGKEPRRRCVVCRTTDPRDALLRFVWDHEDNLFFDVRGRAPGRGVHVCARVTCLEKAIQGAFRRSAKERRVVLPDAAGWIERDVIPGLWAQYRELISIGRQSGALIAGSETVQRAAKADELAGYMLALDASEGTRQKIEENARRKELPILGLFERTRLGKLIGRENVVVLGWRPGGLFDKFCTIERQLKNLGSLTASTRDEGKESQIDNVVIEET